MMLYVDMCMYVGVYVNCVYVCEKCVYIMTVYVLAVIILDCLIAIQCKVNHSYIWLHIIGILHIERIMGILYILPLCMDAGRLHIMRPVIRKQLQVCVFC